MKKLLATLFIFLSAWSLTALAQDDRQDPNFHLGGLTAPDGSTTAINLPEDLRLRNTGGTDGAGLCVFTSIFMASEWQNESSMKDFRKNMENERGGGYPEKVDRMMKKYAPGVQYIQYEGSDSHVIDLAIKTGRMPCITYDGHDPHYGGSISHMVCCIASTDKWGCILDNNYIKDSQLVWMSKEALMQRFGGDGGWCFVLLKPGAPPDPFN